MPSGGSLRIWLHWALQSKTGLLQVLPEPYKYCHLLWLTICISMISWPTLLQTVTGIALELMKEGAMMTVLNTLLAAFAMPATLVTASDLIDSKWAVAVDR